MSYVIRTRWCDNWTDCGWDYALLLQLNESLPLERGFLNVNQSDELTKVLFNENDCLHFANDFIWANIRLENVGDLSLSLSLSLSRTISQWTVNTHKLNLSTWTNFVSRKGWPKNFKATGKTSYYNKYSWHCLFLFRLDLLMAVVSYALWVPTETMQLEYLMQNFLSKMISQGAFCLISK